MTLKEQIHEASKVVQRVVEQPKPALGIDLDGCVDESPFFQILTQVWPGNVYVVTFRDDHKKAVADCEKHNIRFTEVVLAESMNDKARIIKEKGISFYIDDQPEMLKNVPVDVAVMLFRNDGNFDFDDNKWMLSKKTGKLV